MPRRPPTNKPFPFKRPELDLSAMLNPEQANQFQLLMSDIMEEISGQIRDNFDKMTIPQVEPTEGITAPKIMKSHLIDDKSAGPQPALTLPKTPEETIASTKKTEAELIISSLTELKRDALGHVSKWRMLVYKRMQEITIKNGGTSGNVVRQGPQLSLVPPLKNGDASNAQHIKLYPPSKYTSLRNLPKEKRALILHSMLLMFLGFDQYPTYSRLALIKLAVAIDVPTYVLLQDEYRVSQALAQIINGISAEEVAQKRAEEGKTAKRWRAGSVHNPAASSSSNVLAEPLVAVGIGTVFGGVGLSASVAATLLGGIGSADSTVPVGTLFGLYGARQGGKTMDAYAKDIQDLALIQMHGSPQPELLDPKDVLAENRRMRVTIGINGWTTKQTNFRHPWKVFGNLNEVYALRWELEALSKVGDALQTVLHSPAWNIAKKEAAGKNVFVSLRNSHWPGSLIKASKVIDNSWTVAMVRAEKTGLVLAEILTNKVQGERPVSLVGYGLGARVIYACLAALSEKRAFGIIENALLIGAPCPSEIRIWAAMKSIVTGRLINVYSKNDYLLGFLYRTCAWNFGVAGLQPIEGVPRVENVDLSDVISDHPEYPDHIGQILLRLGWEDIDYIETKKDMPPRPAAMTQIHSILASRVNKATPELGERNRNVTKDRKMEQNQKDRVMANQQGGNAESKDKPVGKQQSSKAKPMPKQGGNLVQTDAEQENVKQRQKQGRTENQHPAGAHRPEAK
ncbi:DUF726-domain-containing protein [Xylaria intraflava]|nr:DUF726-domain-containing protein [Xylaria intraflava]